MSGLAQSFDLTDEKQAQEYLETVGIEYRFQCFHEKSPEGCHRLANYLESFKKDYEKARKIFQTTCDDYQYGHSCYKFGNYNFLGRGGEKNFDSSLIYYKKGCDLGYGPSCYNAALSHATDKYKCKDLIQSNKYLHRACELNDTESCQLLSTNYIQGKGCEKDMKKAFEFAMKACEADHIQACGNVSIMFKRGDGVEKNTEKAEEYKQKALDLHKSTREKQRTIAFSE